MQLFMGKKLQRKRWNSRPETQDLQNTRSVEPWSSRTASCQSKRVETRNASILAPAV